MADPSHRGAGARALAAALLVGLVAVVAYGGYTLRELRREVGGLEHEGRITRRLALGASLHADGFAPWAASSAASARAGCSRLLFAGHVYPGNGLVNPPKDAFPDPERVWPAFLALERALAADRVVFGGDTIHHPSAEAIGFIRELRTKLPHARFVIGNHEQWWSEAAAPLREVLGSRHGVEDLGRVRLVHLHSTMRDGRYGLDDEERAFLQQALGGQEHDWAVVMLHHPLWAGDTRVANTDYPGAQALREDWLGEVLPLLEGGRVRLVLTGDGGWRQPGETRAIGGIPHVVTGWPGWRTDIAPEWVVAELCGSGPQVARQRLFEGQLQQREEWPPPTGR